MHLLFVLLLAALFCCQTHSMVTVPEGRSVRTAFFQTTSPANHHLLYLENSPLVGGPAWLPVHVKVILQDRRGVEHRWDMLPINATNVATLAQLLTLQAVPAEIRYQSAPGKSNNKVLLVPPEAGFDIVVSSETTMTKREERTDDDDDDDATNLVQRANEFCATYPHELHLIQNNCWNFALELYDQLSAAMSDGDGLLKTDHSTTTTTTSKRPKTVELEEA